jgi:spore maturation protein B
MTELLGALAIPAVTALVGCVMLFGKRDYFRAFVTGAREGLQTAVNLCPTLVGLMVAISMLHASGAIAWLAGLLSPLAERVGLPPELLPLLITRPFSGSASTAELSALLGSVGPDSLAGLCASVIFGSSDTVIYVISVYFSSIGIRHSRYALPAALSVMLFCIFLACFLCRVCFFS